MEQLIEVFSRLDLSSEDYRTQIETYPNIGVLVEVLGLLKKADLLTQSNLQLVLQHEKIEVLHRSIVYLQEACLLTQAHFLEVSAQTTVAMALILLILSQERILTSEHQVLVTKHPDLDGLSVIILVLKQAGLLNPENFYQALEYQKTRYLAFMAQEYVKKGVFNASMWQILLAHPNIEELYRLMMFLQKTDLMSIENLTMAANHVQPKLLRIGLDCLFQSELLTQENYNLLFSHANFSDLIRQILCLFKVKLLNQTNLHELAVQKDNEALVKGLLLFERAGILTQAKFDLLTESKNLADLSHSLFCLSMRGMLTEEIFALIEPYLNQDDFHWMLRRLSGLNILRDDLFQFVLACPDPHIRGSMVADLQEAKILSQENLLIISQLENNDYVFYLLSGLLSEGFLTQDNFMMVAQHPHPEFIHEALEDNLIPYDLLSQEYFSLVCRHQRPDLMAEGIRELSAGEILTPQNLSCIFKFTCPQVLAGAFRILDEGEMLSDENREALGLLSSRDDLCSAMACLQRNNLLTQANLNSLILPQHQALLTDDADHIVWSRMPDSHLTQADYQQLLIASEHAEPLQELRLAVTRILGRGPVCPPEAINDGQSTHSASVHRSVSTSAQTLRSLYLASFTLSDKLAELRADIIALPSSSKHDAAKRGLERLLSLRFRDSSGVTLVELLALAYAAIQDDSKRMGSLADAKTLLVDGLYEIQRGYNLGESGIDDDGVDAPICMAGSFNKILEKLHGVHPNVEVNVITRKTAAAKFPKLAAAQALIYLQELASPSTMAAAKAFKQLLFAMQQDGTLAPIWADLQAPVSAMMWEEFQEAYPGDEGRSAFAELIDAGVYIPLPELTTISQQFAQSLGCRQYVAAQKLSLSMHHFGLFLPLEDSASAAILERTADSYKRARYDSRSE